MVCIVAVVADRGAVEAATMAEHLAGFLSECSQYVHANLQVRPILRLFIRGFLFDSQFSTRYDMQTTFDVV